MCIRVDGVAHGGFRALWRHSFVKVVVNERYGHNGSQNI